MVGRILADALDEDTVVRFLISLVLGVTFVWRGASNATAWADECSGQTASSNVGATTGVTGILISGEQQVAHSSSCGSVPASLSNGPRNSGLDALCVREALSVGRNPFAYCDLTATSPPTHQPQITQALVLRALRRVELPASELKVQPPGGETLVNLVTSA